MITTYTYNLTNFPNGKLSSDRLTNEIRLSNISISLDHIDSDSLSVYIFFKNSLSDTDKTILDGIITSHSGEPLPSSIPLVKAEILTEQTEYVLNGDILNGYFAAESLVLDVEYDNPEKVLDVKWGFDISLKSSTIVVSDKMIGDEMIVEVSPNTLVGTLTSDLNVDDTTLNVSSTVIENIKKGFYIGLYDTGGTSIEIGRVTEISPNSIKIDKKSTKFLPSGTPLSMFVKIIPYLYFSYMGEVNIGKSIPTGLRVSKGTTIRIRYFNKNGSSGKKVSFFVEYLY